MNLTAKDLALMLVYLEAIAATPAVKLNNYGEFVHLRVKIENILDEVEVEVDA